MLPSASDGELFRPKWLKFLRKRSAMLFSAQFSGTETKRKNCLHLPPPPPSPPAPLFEIESAFGDADAQKTRMPQPILRKVILPLQP